MTVARCLLENLSADENIGRGTHTMQRCRGLQCGRHVIVSDMPNVFIIPQEAAVVSPRGSLTCVQKRRTYLIGLPLDYKIARRGEHRNSHNVTQVIQCLEVFKDSTAAVIAKPPQL